MKRPARLVISYSHKDEQFRSELTSALSPAIRVGELDVWSDHRIVPGRDIDDEIMAQLKEADVIVLLVSHDFVASDYCFKKEMEVALERHRNGRAVVVPVVVRPTDFFDMPFARLKMLPNDAKALTTWGNQDEAWLSVAHGIREAARQLPEAKDEQQPSVFSSKNIRECLSESFDELQMRYVDPDRYRENGTGFDSINALIGSFPAKELAVLAGRPGSGFVELSMSIAQYAAIKHKQRVLVLSQRLSAQKYANRMLCAVGFISLVNLYKGQLEDEDWSRVTASIRMLAHAEITIDDEAIRSLEDLKKKLALARSKSYQMILLDGLEYLSTGTHQDEKAIAFALRDFGHATDVAIICTLSLGREIDERAYRRPLITDLSGWESLEHVSHKILFTTRPEIYSLLGQDHGQPSDFIVEVAKNVDGLLGEATLRLHTQSGAVSDPSMYRDS